VLEVIDLVVTYGAIRAVGGVSLEVRPREIVALVGGERSRQVVHPQRRGRAGAAAPASSPFPILEERQRQPAGTLSGGEPDGAGGVRLAGTPSDLAGDDGVQRSYLGG